MGFPGQPASPTWLIIGEDAIALRLHPDTLGVIRHLGLCTSGQEERGEGDNRGAGYQSPSEKGEQRPLWEAHGALGQSHAS